MTNHEERKRNQERLRSASRMMDIAGEAAKLSKSLRCEDYETGPCLIVRSGEHESGWCRLCRARSYLENAYVALNKFVETAYNEELDAQEAEREEAHEGAMELAYEL